MSTTWYLILGGLLVLYFGLAGIDYGVGLLLPAMRDDADRRKALNALGPMFLGNEVWIVAVVGVLIAAFPRVDGELFAATYPIMVPLLLALAAFNAAVQLRGRAVRRRGVDLLVTVAAAVLAFGWGMALGALVGGLPLTADGHVAGFGALVTPYTLMMGLAGVAVVALHGAGFLAWRLPPGALRTRMTRLGSRLAVPAAVAVLLSLLLVYAQRDVARNPVPAAVLGLVVVAAALGAGWALRRGRPGVAFLAGLVTAVLPVVAVGVALFPDVLVSSVDPDGTVSVADGAAGDGALRTLTMLAAPTLPVLLAVQASCWWMFRHRQPMYW